MCVNACACMLVQAQVRLYMDVRQQGKAAAPI